MTINHRYRLDDGRYWGTTDLINDDPECGYTEQEPPAYTYLETIPVWTGSEWIIKPLVNGLVES